MPDQFRVMDSAVIKSVPWSLVAPCANRALVNHDQTLERLNERGGLSPEELYALLRDEGYRTIISVRKKHAERYIQERLRLHTEPMH